MQVNDTAIYQRATGVIQRLYGSGAAFRKGQYEAIEATLTNRRTLVVQKTGWGKSLVYFACTKLLREQGAGVTIVVSPLLVLMENQIEAAQKLGLSCDVMNSTVADRREAIIQNLVAGKLDLVLVTPETLFREDIQGALKDIHIGLFVIDEAHCISDWGHDFRLDYGNLYKVLGALPRNVPVLATTATANDRVVADLSRQLGEDVFVSRGPLTRESLAIQVLPKQNKAERYAWILQNIHKLPGSGIIYCLTQRDCDYLADFLQQNGVRAMAYYSRKAEEDALNREAEDAFRTNQIKALVATIKLGMGYDKGDIGFVIHYQLPANIVSYYQQIGRAGRGIPKAYAFLMHGHEDADIVDFFIETAFPSETEAGEIVGMLEAKNGQSLNEIAAGVNIRRGRIEKALSFLVNEGFLMKEKSKYYLTPKPFQYNQAHYSAVTGVRKTEQERIQSLLTTKECYSRYIVNSLDDFTAKDCGHCANCLGRPLIDEQPGQEFVEKALLYIDGMTLDITPRKRWALTGGTRQTAIAHTNQPGLCLSKYGDIGYGALVKRDKYGQDQRFCDELVGKSAALLRPLVVKERITAVTCVPSLRSGIVQDFAQRLAGSLGLAFVPTLEKSPAQPQKEMENSSHQCQNALHSFSIKQGPHVLPKNILLVDDVVDSKWTLTVCGFLMMQAGSEKVFPFALADSSQRED